MMTTAPKRKDNLDLIEIWAQDPLEFCLFSLAGTLLMNLNEKVDGDKEYKWHEPSELFAILDDHLLKSGKKEDIQVA
jgi:hypothetical protein